MFSQLAELLLQENPLDTRPARPDLFPFHLLHPLLCFLLYSIAYYICYQFCDFFCNALSFNMLQG